MQRPFRFRPPAPGPTTVLRPRLLGPLGRRFEVRVVTVEAGAGLGKTSVLAQAVHENRLAPRGRDCWLTCETADSSASVLLEALLAVAGGRPTESPPTVRDVCEAVWSAAPEQVCLVLDDAQHLEPGSEGEASLARLLQELPENGHLVVAARRLPHLPRARLVVQGRAAELSEDDLRLDGRETAEFAAGHGVGVELLDDAGGWAALAELRARTGDAHAERFAWEEVVAPLPAAEREAFLLLVELGGADADSLATVAGSPFDSRVLAGLPLVDVDEHGGLRPHPLWEDLLRRRRDPEATAAARGRLAAVLRDRGDHGGAFELLAAAGDWDAALGTLFEACNDQRRPPWPDQMARWRRLVPDVCRDRPEVAYVEAMIARATDPWSGPAADAFAAAIDGFRRQGRLLQEAVATVRYSYVAWLRGDRAALDAMYERSVELVDAGVPLEPIRVLNRLAAGDLDGLAPGLLPDPHGLDLEPRLRHFPGLFRTFGHLAMGDADAAVRDAADAAAAAVAVQPAAGTGWAAVAPAAVAWARGDVDAVPAEILGDPGPRHSLAERVLPMALSVVVAAHLGREEEATGRLAELDELVPHIGPRDLLAGFRAVAGAAAAVAGGDEDAVVAELDCHLTGREPAPSAAGRAVRWWPSLPYLFHPPSRELLDALPTGPARARVLEACRALLAARAGERPTAPALLDDPPALLAALPAPLATELLTRLEAAGTSTPTRPALVFLADRAADAVRGTLRRLAGDGGDGGVRQAARSLLGAVPIPPAHDVRIEVLGPARLLHDGRPVDNANWRRRRVRELVCALVAYREVRRARLGVLLWPDADEAAVSANLRMTLSYVQGLLEPARARGDAPWFLRQDAGVLGLRGGPHLSVDAWELDEHLSAADVAAAEGTPSTELAHLLAAVELWKGDYLDDVAGDEWADPLRERVRQRFVRAAVRAGELLIAAGRHAEAGSAAAVAVQADAYAEDAYRIQVRALLAAGDRGAARRALDACVQRLGELGVEPDEATRSLKEGLV